MYHPITQTFSSDPLDFDAFGAAKFFSPICFALALALVFVQVAQSHLRDLAMMRPSQNGGGSACACCQGRSSVVLWHLTSACWF